jgi:hypothetical protein
MSVAGLCALWDLVPRIVVDKSPTIIDWKCRWSMSPRMRQLIAIDVRWTKR